MNDETQPLEAAWADHAGRNRRLQNCAAAGFSGEYPFASVVAVAEGRGGSWRSASLVVSHIRDIFAEGVAYGIGETLVEAMLEAGSELRAKGLRGCSATAAAILAGEVWIAHVGNGRAYHVEGGSRARPVTTDHTLDREMGLEPGDPGFRLRKLDLTRNMAQEKLEVDLHHLALERGQALVLCTSSIWNRMPGNRMASLGTSAASAENASGQLIRESKVRHRIGGGASALVRRGTFGAPWRRLRPRRIAGRVLLGLAAASVLVIASLIFSRLIRGGDPSDRDTVAPADSASRPDASEVFPLISPFDREPVAVEDTMAAPVEMLASRLPLGCVVMSPVADHGSLPPDSFRLCAASPIDTLYENGLPGVYCLREDSGTLDDLLTGLSDRLGLPGPVYLDRFVLVRDDAAPEFASWLPGLPDSAASATAVIVETSRSVAGGRGWIRGFPVYANGDLSLSDSVSCFTGSAIAGMPADSAPSGGGYSIVIVPEGDWSPPVDGD